MADSFLLRITDNTVEFRLELLAQVFDLRMRGAFVSRKLAPTQTREQFSVDTAETAIAENDDHIAALHDFRKVRDDGVRVRQIRRRLARRADVLHQFFRVQPLFRREQLQPRNLRNNHAIGIRK